MFAKSKALPIWAKVVAGLLLLLFLIALIKLPDFRETVLGFAIIGLIIWLFTKRRRDANKYVKFLQSIDPKRIVVFDTETTGLKPGYDEILSIAITDGDGEVKLHELVKPVARRSWASAQRVHGISPADVKGKEPISAHAKRISKLFEDAHLIVGYNAGFDMSILQSSGIPTNQFSFKTFDLMQAYAPLNGVWMESKQDWQWAKLSECAAAYGYQFKAHDALEDARATAHCFQRLIRDPRYAKSLSKK